MRKHILKLFATFLCLAFLLSACRSTATPEESSNNEIPDSSESETPIKNSIIPSDSSHTDWTGPLVWYTYSFNADDYLYYIAGHNVGNNVPTILANSPEHALFCIAVNKRYTQFLDLYKIPYDSPISLSDYIDFPNETGEKPDDYVRAYVDRQEIMDLINHDCVVSITVPERPEGYPDKFSDSLAFLLETSDWEKYSVSYTYINCPRLLAQRGRFKFMEPKDPPAWYYQEYGFPDYANEESEWYGNDTLTREDIFKLAEDPEIRYIFPETDIYAADLEQGETTNNTETISWTYEPMPEPENSSEENNSDSSLPDPGSNDIPIVSNHSDWTGPLVWRTNIEVEPEEQRGYKVGDHYVGRDVPMILLAAPQDSYFCIAVPKKDVKTLDKFNIPYSTSISESDYLNYSSEEKEKPEDYVRAYVDRQEIMELIHNDCFVSITVPERPEGYPDKFSDSLAFLLDTSDFEEYEVVCTYTNCPRVMATRGRLTFMEPENPPSWYYNEELFPPNYDEEQEWGSVESMTKEEIFDFAMNPDIRYIFPQTYVYGAHLFRGKPTGKTDRIQ